MAAMTAPAGDLPPPPEGSFASDNAAGVSPEVLDALAAANHGAALAYGDDAWTARMEALLRERFDAPVVSLPCWGGTGANVVGLATVMQPWEAVISADCAHIVVDEAGALVTVRRRDDDPRRPRGGSPPARCHRAVPPVAEQRAPPAAQGRVDHAVHRVRRRLQRRRGRRALRRRPCRRAPGAPRRRPHRQRPGRDGVGPADDGARHGRRPHDPRAHQGRGDVRRDRRLPPARAGRAGGPRAQAGRPALVEGPVHRRPGRGAARPTTSGCATRRTPTPWPTRLAEAAPGHPRRRHRPDAGGQLGVRHRAGRRPSSRSRRGRSSGSGTSPSTSSAG